MQRARRDTLASLGQGGGPVDYNAAATKLLAAGDMQGAQTLASLGNNNRDFQFRQQESNRAQGNTDRSFGLQEKTANTAQVIPTEDNQGNKVLLRVNRDGTSSPIPIPGNTSAPTNPYSSGKMNETQAKDGLYASRMFNAEKVLRQPDVISGSTSFGQSAIEGTPFLPSGVKNWLHSEGYQKFDQAKRDFVNSVLRRESGAAISQSEFDNAEKQYFPMPGDTPAKIEQKKQNRAEAIKGVAGGAGRGFTPANIFGPNGEIIANPASNPQSGASAQPASGGAKQITTKAERDALQPGTLYIGPDGVPRTKQ